MTGKQLKWVGVVLAITLAVAAGCFIDWRRHYYSWVFSYSKRGDKRQSAIYFLDELAGAGVLREFELAVADQDPFVRIQGALALSRRGRLDGLRYLAGIGNGKHSAIDHLRREIHAFPEPPTEGTDVSAWFTKMEPSLQFDSGWKYVPREK